MDRMDCIRSALSAVRSRMNEKDSLIERLRAERDEKAALLEHFRELAEMTTWAELDSGSHIAVGVRVRHMLHVYVCVKDHTKALIRSPIDTQYWQREDIDT